MKLMRCGMQRQVALWAKTATRVQRQTTQRAQVVHVQAAQAQGRRGDPSRDPVLEALRDPDFLATHREDTLVAYFEKTNHYERSLRRAEGRVSQAESRVSQAEKRGADLAQRAYRDVVRAEARASNAFEELAVQARALQKVASRTVELLIIRNAVNTRGILDLLKQEARIDFPKLPSDNKEFWPQFLAIRDPGVRQLLACIQKKNKWKPNRAILQLLSLHESTHSKAHPGVSVADWQRKGGLLLHRRATQDFECNMMECICDYLQLPTRIDLD